MPVAESAMEIQTRLLTGTCSSASTKESLIRTSSITKKVSYVPDQLRDQGFFRFPELERLKPPLL